jgi:predicted alpha/beta-hydrolase family hydrolase
VLHGSRATKEAPLNQWLCEGAAQLGLTALRFDFRYVHSQNAFQPDMASCLDDLAGAYNFLQSFGKEIKPKRLYLLGKSLGAMVAMQASTRGLLAGVSTGIAALGLPLHDVAKQQYYDYSELPKLNCPALFVIGELDSFGTPAELKPLLSTLNVPFELVTIPQVGHSYEPLAETLSQVDRNEQQSHNQQQVVALVLKWLAQQEADRPSLRT